MIDIKIEVVDNLVYISGSEEQIIEFADCLKYGFKVCPSAGRFSFSTEEQGIFVSPKMEEVSNDS